MAVPPAPEDGCVLLTIPGPQGFIDPAIWVARSLATRQLLFHALHASAERVLASAAFRLRRLQIPTRRLII